MVPAELIIAVLTVAGTILGTILTLRSQDHKETMAHDVEMARLQEEIQQMLLTAGAVDPEEGLLEEIVREREKRHELEQRVEALEHENRILEGERYKRIELERKSVALEERVGALETENLDLKRRLNAK